MDPMRKKLQNALKLNGFIVRSELCKLIVEALNNHGELENRQEFDSYLKTICVSLEKQCLTDKSIEKDNILQAIAECLHSGYDKHETVFNVISAFDTPNFIFDYDRKIFVPCVKKPKLLPDADSKSRLFIERYNTVLQRTKRNLLKISNNENNEFILQTVDYLLSTTKITLEKTLILGSLLLVSEGKYYLEDTSGKVQLDLTFANFDKGFFVENCFVLVNGEYEDKILRVATIIMPSGENYNESRVQFGNVNYFGGSSLTPLRDSIKLKQHLQENKHGEFLIFSDFWLDHPSIFEKMEVIFKGMEENPPICFIFMGNFLIRSIGSEKLENLKKLLKQFGELVSNYRGIVSNSYFIFVPGLEDPCASHIVPRLPLPLHVTDEVKKYIPKAIFTTNPCRIQYCTREIVIFRADIITKMMHSTIQKPKKEKISESLIKTIISQGHLSPMSLNSLPVYWDYDFTLRLYPLPDLVVIGDKSDPYQGVHHGCTVVNPGPFCDNNKFEFKLYYPHANTVTDCDLC